MRVSVMAATGIPTPTRQISSTPSPSSPAVAVRVKQLSPATRHSRRTSLLLLLHLPSLSASPPPASSLGISGPKEWLKDQKKKTSKFILAPVEASRRSLQDAFSVLSTEKVEVEGDDVRKLLNSAARDCVADDRSSIVAFQAQTGVEVCTFSLLVKNAASLLDDNDPVKLDTEARLGELVRSFSSLGSLVDTSDLQLPSDRLLHGLPFILHCRQKVEAGLKETMLALDNFERGIKNCLGV